MAPNGTSLSNDGDATPILSLTRNISVRPLLSTDAESMAHHANNRKLWMNMRDRFPHPYRTEDGESWIAFVNDQKGWINSGPGTGFGAETVWDGPLKVPCYAVCVNDKVVGGVGLTPGVDVHRRVVELGYWLGEDFWGQKIMSEVVPAFVAWVWRTFDKFVRIEANTYEWNPASAALLKKAGFELMGRRKLYVWKDGKLGDVFDWGLIRPGLERA